MLYEELINGFGPKTKLKSLTRICPFLTRCSFPEKGGFYVKKNVISNYSLREDGIFFAQKERRNKIRKWVQDHVYEAREILTLGMFE